MALTFFAELINLIKPDSVPMDWPLNLMSANTASKGNPLITAASSMEMITAIQLALQVIAGLQLTGSNYPDQSCVFDGRSYDYIIIGAGTAGCVVASRLVEDNKTTVLLIESGDDPKVEANLPALLLYVKSSGASWNYTIEDPGIFTQAHKPTNDDMVLGRSLGGTSATSYLLYSSGNKYDYDNWAEVVNDDTWNWENVLPYLKKSQRLQDASLLKTDGEFYGQNGNIGLTLLRNAGTIDGEPYIQAFREMGNEFVPSVNGNISLGYMNALYTISDSKRQDTASSYITPQKDNPNLYVLKNSLVKRVIIDGYKRAIGVVAYICSNRYVSIKARKEVILSAGVVNTPKLLMLSGIGPKEELCKHQILTISDLPVGEGLQDHLGVTMIYNMTKLVVPYRPFDPYEYPSTVLVGYVALNKSNEYPDYQSFSYTNFPQYLMKYCTFTYFYTDIICNNTISTSVNSQMLFSVINKQRFKSRGKILLRNKDFKAKPIIYSGYYTVDEDLEDHARLVQDFARVVTTPSFKNIGGEFKDPKLPDCGDYDLENLEYWKCYVQYMVTSQHQYSSTCAMGSVVDSRLRVYGIKGLRVVDASIMPNVTAGGTLGSTIMIGEKAADFIKEDRYN